MQLLEQQPWSLYTYTDKHVVGLGLLPILGGKLDNCLQDFDNSARDL